MSKVQFSFTEIRDARRNNWLRRRGSKIKRGFIEKAQNRLEEKKCRGGSVEGVLKARRVV